LFKHKYSFLQVRVIGIVKHHYGAFSTLGDFYNHIVFE